MRGGAAIALISIAIFLGRPSRSSLASAAIGGANYDNDHLIGINLLMKTEIGAPESGGNPGDSN